MTAGILRLRWWSAKCRQIRTLRAALPIGGRALTLYEEVHPLARFGNPRVHRAFLAKLEALLPEGVKPILIADAGFRAPHPVWRRVICAS